MITDYAKYWCISVSVSKCWGCLKVSAERVIKAKIPSMQYVVCEMFVVVQICEGTSKFPVNSRAFAFGSWIDPLAASAFGHMETLQCVYPLFHFLGSHSHSAYMEC